MSLKQTKTRTVINWYSELTFICFALLSEPWEQETRFDEFCCNARSNRLLLLAWYDAIHFVRRQLLLHNEVLFVETVAWESNSTWFQICSFIYKIKGKLVNEIWVNSIAKLAFLLVLYVHVPLDWTRAAEVHTSNWAK